MTNRDSSGCLWRRGQRHAARRVRTQRASTSVLQPAAWSIAHTHWHPLGHKTYAMGTLHQHLHMFFGMQVGMHFGMHVGQGEGGRALFSLCIERGGEVTKERTKMRCIA